MTSKERDKLDIITDHLEVLSERSERIERGLYGDKDNGVKGLIERQEDDEKRGVNVELRLGKIEYNHKLLWRGATALFGSGGMIYGAYAYFFK